MKVSRKASPTAKMCLFWRKKEDLDKDAFGKTREIDRLIRTDEKRMMREVKMLLLGAGESGKSTILKQMKLLYATGFSKLEKDDYRCIVFANMLNAFKTILEAMEYYDLTFERRENENYVHLIVLDRELARGERLPVEYLMAFKSLWADEGVQAAVARGNEFALHDNLTYYLDDLDRLFRKDWVPNDQDILRCRLKTTGITETVFELGALSYRMFDVGGQRSERKKWIHCFENVTGLLFLVAISGYDQCLVEDKDGNQMQEALMLFESISNSQWFIRTALILFLNKMDLFKTKIRSCPIPKYFPDFIGDPKDTKQASKFFQAKFKSLNRNPNKEIYTHFTNATDTNLLKITMDSVQDMIIQRNLDHLMF